jgi:transposase
MVGIDAVAYVCRQRADRSRRPADDFLDSGPRHACHRSRREHSAHNNRPESWSIVAERCPAAAQCADPFHVVKWATEALDEVRRQAWNQARRSGQTRGKGYGNRVATGDARRFKNARYALWKNPDNLTNRQRDKLAWIAKTDPRLYRAYLLNERLRYVFTAKGEAGKTALDR